MIFFPYAGEVIIETECNRFIIPIKIQHIKHLNATLLHLKEIYLCFNVHQECKTRNLLLYKFLLLLLLQLHNNIYDINWEYKEKVKLFCEEKISFKLIMFSNILILPDIFS